MKPYSQACENNKEPLLAILRETLRGARRVLEIGSGTGQHAVYFAAHLPHLVWHTSDLPPMHTGIRAWLEASELENVRAPLALDVDAAEWPVGEVDAVFSANTLHILPWRSVEHLFQGVGRVLGPRGVLAVYGPFKFEGRYTSASNESFDRFLRARDPQSGVRDFEALDALAAGQGLAFAERHVMPAHNETLIWRRA